MLAKHVVFCRENDSIDKVDDKSSKVDDKSTKVEDKTKIQPSTCLITRRDRSFFNSIINIASILNDKMDLKWNKGT
jgi:hypothetical protein